MNLNAMLVGIFLVALGVLIIIFTYGIGIICIWPLLILGGLLFLAGLFSPSQRSFFKQFQQRSQQFPQQEMKRICSQCKKTVSMNQKICPHCGHEFEY